jgi:hypothetical protein
MVLRVHGELVGVTAGPAHICVFQVEGVRDGEVRMRPVAEFDTPHGIFKWNIWNNQVRADTPPYLKRTSFFCWT